MSTVIFCNLSNVANKISGLSTLIGEGYDSKVIVEYDSNLYSDFAGGEVDNQTELLNKPFLFFYVAGNKIKFNWRLSNLNVLDEYSINFPKSTSISSLTGLKMELENIVIELNTINEIMLIEKRILECLA